LVKQVKQLPEGLMSSLTWDRGTELAAHSLFTVLLRQYFPKGADLSVYSQADLNAVALKLNTRPRKTLGFITPGAKLAQGVAFTG
jgi:IS30 family transposase